MSGSFVRARSHSIYRGFSLRTFLLLLFAASFSSFHSSSSSSCSPITNRIGVAHDTVAFNRPLTVSNKRISYFNENVISETTCGHYESDALSGRDGG